MNHAPGCTPLTPVPNCFQCHMESEKRKYGDSVQFYSGNTLTLQIDDKGNLSPQ